MAQKKTSGRKNKDMSGAQKVGIGVGLTATALAAVGGYFFYGSKHAAQNRKNAKSWMLRAKAEVLEKLEDAKEMSKEEYEEMVDRVAKGYKTAKGASTRELLEFASEMKAHWKNIEKAGRKKTASTARSVAKKADPKKPAAKKSTKRTTTKKK